MCKQLERHVTDSVQLRRRNNVFMRGYLKDAVRGRIDNWLAGANVLGTETVDDLGARRHDIAQRAAPDSTFELGHQVKRKSAWKRWKRVLQDDTHHFPMPRDGVLASRGLRHASICAGR